MNTIEAFPLSWPVGWKRTAQPKRSQFKNDKTIDSASKELLLQLSRMKATGIVLSSNIPVKNNGLPYSTYRVPDDKGIAVYFNLRNVPHVLACDCWDKIEHNIWAIAKHIESLRAQDRWGVGSLEQSFAGFKALPAAAAEQEEAAPAWWKVFNFPHPNLLTITEDDILNTYKALAKQWHPDAGGSEEKMKLLNWAKEEGLKALKK